MLTPEAGPHLGACVPRVDFGQVWDVMAGMAGGG